jgi:hypothetical protein
LKNVILLSPVQNIRTLRALSTLKPETAMGRFRFRKILAGAEKPSRPASDARLLKVK